VANGVQCLLRLGLEQPDANGSDQTVDDTKLDRQDEAVICFDRALGLGPDFEQALWETAATLATLRTSSQSFL